MKLSEFRIRSFRSRDLTRLLEIRRKSLAKEFEIFGFNEERLRKQFRLYRLTRMFERLTGSVFFRVYVGEVDDLVVGITCLSKNDEFWHISMVMVDPEYRRRGYGRSLVSKACSDAKSFRAKGAILYVFEDNVPAKNLYKSLGFIKFERRAYFHMDARKLDEKKIPLGYKLLRINVFDRNALRVTDASRDEDSAKVYGKSHLPPFYIRLFARIFKTGTAENYAIVLDKHCIGAYSLNFESEKTSSVSLSLLREYRGHGIEEAILTQAVTKTFKFGIPRITIDFNEKNRELKEACEKLGFKRTSVMECMVKSFINQTEI